MDEQLAALVAEVARVLHHQALADADLVVLARQFLDHQPGVGAQQLAQAGQQRRGVQRVVQGPGAEQDIHRVRRHALVEKIAVHVEAAEAYPRLVGEALAGGGEEVAGNVGEQVVHLRPSLHQRRQPGDHRAAGGGGAGAKLQQAPAPLRLALDDGGDGLGHGLVQRLGMQALAVHGLGDARRALREHQRRRADPPGQLLAEGLRAVTQVGDQLGRPERRRRAAGERRPGVLRTLRGTLGAAQPALALGAQVAALLQLAQPVAQQALARLGDTQALAQGGEVQRRRTGEQTAAGQPGGQRGEAGTVECGHRRGDALLAAPVAAQGLGRPLAHRVERRTRILASLRRRMQGDEAGQAALVGLAEHHGGRQIDLRMSAQRGVQLGQFDAVAANLHLVVLAAEELDAAVGQIAAEVAGAIQATAIGVTDEAFGGALRIAGVAERQAHPADMDLAAHARRAAPPAGIQDFHALPAQGTAIRDAGQLGVLRADRLLDRPDRRLGGAAQAEQRAVRPAPPPAGRQADRNPVTGPEHAARSRQVTLRLALQVIDEHLALGRHRVPQGDGVAFQQFRPVRWIAAARRVREDHLGPRRGGAEEVVDREVEAQLGEAEDAVVGVDAVALVDVEQRVAHRRMAEHHALWRAGGAGGVDHVGEVVRRHLRRGRWRPGAVGGQPVDGHAGAADVRDIAFQANQRDHFGAGEDRLAPQRRLADVYRHIGGAGLEDADHRDQLRGAFRQHHRDPPATARAVRFQDAAQGAGVLGDLAVAVAAGGIVDHRGVGGQQGTLGETGGDAPGTTGQRLRRRLDGFRGIAVGPGARALRQAPEQPDEVVEHGFRLALGEQPEAYVPADLQAAELVGDLAVQPDLRGLADHVAWRARRLAIAEQALHAADATGEHHRHQIGAATTPARQFAQQVDAAEGRVVEVVEHLLADASGTLDETVAVAAVHCQQAERGEVTEHLRQLRMQRRPVEYRQVETERRCLAPATDGLGEGRQGHAGSAQAVFAGARAERLPGGLVEARVEVPEARGPGVRLHPQRQVGTPR
ncbi:Uncharacterised protein [Acinetobacter baumannii]|nr:Uncharacterised protein [Acinetobacter baumannii]